MVLILILIATLKEVDGMQAIVSKEDAKKLVGQHIFAVKKDGSVVTGKLVRVKGNELLLETGNNKQARTKAIAPLVLFDLLAIGTLPYYYGYPGFYGYPGYGGGYIFW
jgi:hypothetical protein